MQQKRDPMDRAMADLLSIFKKGGRRQRVEQAGDVSAIVQILRFFKTDGPEPPEELGLNERLDYMLRPSGIMRRRIRLEGSWWKDASGPMLAWRKDGCVVALLPARGGYFYWDQNGLRVRISRKNAQELETEAFCFYRSYPARPLRLRDALRLAAESVSIWDIGWVLAATLCVSLLGLVLPQVNQLIFDQIIPGGLAEDILPVTILLIGVTLGNMLFSISRTLILSRLRDKMTAASASAVMARIFSLPVSFFQKYSSGELAQRAESMNVILSMISDTVLTAGLAALFSFLYIFQMAAFAPSLIGPGLVSIAAMMAVMIAAAVIQIRVTKKRSSAMLRRSGLVFGMLKGIQKIKLAGVEKNAFAKWAELYAEEARLEYNPPFLLRTGNAVSAAVTLGGTLLLYWVAGAGGVSQSDYIAFSAAFGAISGAMLSLAGLVTQMAAVKPMMELVRPIFQAQPETAEGKRQTVSLNGEVELSHVSFRYGAELPLVLEDFSLHVSPGEYVGIVGKSGCGKSTLMRLMIGFERPEVGAVYYDGEDLREFDLRSLRQHIGVELQNGKLFAGSIFDNITITAPWSTMEDAWEAARLAGIAEDIEKMPMGMMTMVGEGSSGISGGQRQRILIARALVGKPKILLFDEATSALDNIVQNQVAEHIAGLGCTRIAIAHRLSTVKQCDRIVMIDGGKIAEEGTYQELMDRKGLFYDFAVRQI